MKIIVVNMSVRCRSDMLHTLYKKSCKCYDNKSCSAGVLGHFFLCSSSESIVSCMSGRAAAKIEQFMDKTVPFFGDIRLVRNGERVNRRRSKSLDGVDKLLSVLSDFIDTHTFSIDLTNSTARPLDEGLSEARKGGGGGGGGGYGGGGGGGGMFNMKGIKKERQYYQYAFMVLLGIFGLTGPLVMKILGVIAAKSLLAAKAALIIVGSVALKKLFENNRNEKPKIKVTTLPIHEEDDEHDRISYSFNHIPYGYVSYGFNDPYSAHYPGNNINDNGFEPVTYSKKTNS
ncbi:unnamed protein product [Phyllotreta striolata]|uniref:Uncharacterized protein n=1 Tax=Phyllotreta striolata TaxID=444603 RepID=A0A9N9TCW8_PHYSR|nr:unnamed protein product [Phyllotreta striolata]